MNKKLMMVFACCASFVVGGVCGYQYHATHVGDLARAIIEQQDKRIMESNARFLGITEKRPETKTAEVNNNGQPKRPW